MTDRGPRHHRLDASAVERLCACLPARMPRGAGVEIERLGFLLERTPWAAMRLANALSAAGRTPEVVAELDAIGAAAGLAPGPRGEAVMWRPGVLRRIIARLGG